MIRYAITEGTPSLESCRRWAAARLDYVQLRSKEACAGELAMHARAMVPLLGKTKLLINGRADIALAAGTAGVHLTAHPGELTPSQVGRVFSNTAAPLPVISISCHTIAEVQEATRAGVNLILFGPVFEKRIAADATLPGCGLNTLAEACQMAGSTPVLALGGVIAANTADCLGAGAQGVAGIRLFK